MDTLTPDDLRRVDQVVELLRQSRSLLFITGAGLSADSGLPTYRGVGGLYDGRDPEEGVPIETLLSAAVLEKRPELTWKYLLQIEHASRSARRTADTRSSPRWRGGSSASGCSLRTWTAFTTGPGRGTSSTFTATCTRFGVRGARFEQSVTDYEGFSLPPLCPHCRGVLRPDVTLFGERLPARQLATYHAETAQRVRSGAVDRDDERLSVHLGPGSGRLPLPQAECGDQPGRNGRDRVRHGQGSPRRRNGVRNDLDAVQRLSAFFERALTRRVP